MNKLTLVHNNGIVNVFQVSDYCELDLDDENKMKIKGCSSPEKLNINNQTLNQIIWNNELKVVTYGLNNEASEIVSNIKSYRAIYINGILIVKNGKVYPKKSIRVIIANWFSGKEHY